MEVIHYNSTKKSDIGESMARKTVDNIVFKKRTKIDGLQVVLHDAVSFSQPENIEMDQIIFVVIVTNEGDAMIFLDALYFFSLAKNPIVVEILYEQNPVLIQEGGESPDRCIKLCGRENVGEGVSHTENGVEILMKYLRKLCEVALYRDNRKM